MGAAAKAHARTEAFKGNLVVFLGTAPPSRESMMVFKITSWF
jgi:hypothetical protein